MEHKYGLSPRGDKSMNKLTTNGYNHDPNFGKHVKKMSSSNDDLTRLDRHQPIIIQNFELLTPSELKFHRRSLSTANLYLSHASLARSAGVSPDERPATVAAMTRNPPTPIWASSTPKDKSDKSVSNANNTPSTLSNNAMNINNKTNTTHTNNINSNNNNNNSNSNSSNHRNADSSPSSTSSTMISTNQKGKDKQKRVTFSSQNILHPYEPDWQTSRVNSRPEFNHFIKPSDFAVPSRSETVRQYQPFRQTGLEYLYNKYSDDDNVNNNHSNKESNSDAKNGDPHLANNSYDVENNGHTSNLIYDTTTYSDQWIPSNSLLGTKDDTNDDVIYHRPQQRSSLKQTTTANNQEVKRSNSDISGKSLNGHIGHSQGQSDRHSKTHSIQPHRSNHKSQHPDQLQDSSHYRNKTSTNHIAGDVMDDARSTSRNYRISQYNSDNFNSDIDLGPGINSRAVSLLKTTNSHSNNNIENLPPNDFIDHGVYYANDEVDNYNDCDDNDSIIALPELDEIISSYVKGNKKKEISDINTDNCDDVSTNMASDGMNSTSKDDKQKVPQITSENSQPAFFDIFSSYDVSDTEYNKMNNRTRSHKQFNNNNTPDSGNVEFNGEVAATENGNQEVSQITTTTTTTNKTTKDGDSQQTSNSTHSSDPKVIRLKFLVDTSSDKTSDNKIEETNHKFIYDGAATQQQRETATTKPFLKAAPSSFTPRNSKSTPVTNNFRPLKTKSTIEAVDLSTLSYVPNERPKSQGDSNAQFLMRMYSPSGDRRTADDIEEDAHPAGVDSPDVENNGVPFSRPPSRKPTDKVVSFSVDELPEHLVRYRDPLASSNMGRFKERQLLSASRNRRKGKGFQSEPLLKHRSPSAQSMMITGSRIMGKERVVAAEKFLLKTENTRSKDRTCLNRQLEKLIVSRSQSARVRLTMERSRSNLV